MQAEFDAAVDMTVAELERWLCMDNAAVGARLAGVAAT